MGDSNNKGEENMHDESTELELKQRLAEEITILRIEGTLFCFDPREARRRTGRSLARSNMPMGKERPVSVDIHPRYGQPSVLAYKIVQAIFLKMTEEGYPYTNTVTFTQRELARLVGARHMGGKRKSATLSCDDAAAKNGINCSIITRKRRSISRLIFLLSCLKHGFQKKMDRSRLV